MAGISHNLTISATSVPGDGSQNVIGGATFTGITTVNALAGQQLTAASFTLNTDAAPSTYPTPGNLSVRVQDSVGNTFPVLVSYTGVSGSSFTGCSVTDSPGETSVTGVALPLLEGAVSINRTGTGSHPWLNTLTSASVLTIEIQASTDGGTTWVTVANNGGAVGGPIVNPKNGQVVTVETIQVGPLDAATNAVQMVCSATGPSAIEISGSGSVTSR